MKLASKLHISDVESLTQQLTELLNSGQSIEIDISDVESVDTASIQTLCALQKSLLETENKVKWIGSSNTFQEAADTLGVSDFLSISN